MKSYRVPKNYQSFIDDSMPIVEDVYNIDLNQISETIYEDIKKRFNEDNINKNEFIYLSKMKLKTIKSKNYKYQDFLKFTYFFYSKYSKINSFANKKFDEFDKKHKLKDYEYPIKFININLKSKKGQNALASPFKKEFDDNDNEFIHISSSKSESYNNDENININNNKLNEDKNIINENENESNEVEEENEFLKKKRKIKNIQQKNENYKIKKDNNISNNEKIDCWPSNSDNEKNYELNLLRTINNIFPNNINIKSKSSFDSSEDNINEKYNNDIFRNEDKENIYTEEKPSKRLLIMKSNDEDYKNFKKNLSDYLERIIGENRKKVFFSKLLPESVEIMKGLLSKKNNIIPGTVIPIYRNDYLELSLIIKNRGKISKRILYKKE